MHTQLPTERQKRDSRPTEQLTIGQLARLTGISAKAIRYYESIGLLPAPERANNGYRCYTQVDVNRLILLQRLQLLGVPLAALKSLLAGTSDARCSEVQHEVLALVHARLMALDQEIKELHLLREQVESYQSRLASCPTDEHQPFRACLDSSCLALGSEIR